MDSKPPKAVVFYVLLCALIAVCTLLLVLYKVTIYGKNSAAMEFLGKPYSTHGEDPADFFALFIEFPILVAFLWPALLCTAGMKLFKD